MGKILNLPIGLVVEGDAVTVSFVYRHTNGKMYQVKGICYQTEIPAPEGAPTTDGKR